MQRPETLQLNQDYQILNEAIAIPLEGLEEPEPMTLSEYMDKNFYLSPESSSVAGRWKTLPYQKAICDIISNDDVEVVDLMKAARVGYTKIIMGAAAYFIEHKRRNGVIYQPTDSDAEDFSKTEVDTLIRDMPVLEKAFKGDIEKKSKFNSMEKKVFMGAILDLRGGKTPRNYRRLTKDFVIYDELAAFDRDIAGEGSPLSLGDTRVETSSFPKSIRGSSPKLKHFCLIEECVDDADIVLHRYLPCIDCPEWFILEWDNMTFSKKTGSTTKYTCPHCGSNIDYSNYKWMDENGFWGTVELDFFYDEKSNCFRAKSGTKIKTPRHVAFKIWSAYSYFKHWSALEDEYLEAYDKLQKGDEAKMKTFVNTRKGMTWAPTVEEIDHDLLSKRAIKSKKLPPEILLLTLSVDVQGGKDARLEGTVLGWAPGVPEECYVIEHEILYGDPEGVQVWDKLDDYREKLWENTEGRELKISGTAIDAGHAYDAVTRYCKARKKQRVFPVKGQSQYNKPIVAKPSKQSLEKGVLLYPIGTDTAKNAIYARLNIKEPGPGYIHFMGDLPKDYYEQLTSEHVETTKNKHGQKVRKYVLKPGMRNEALDCFVYGMAILSILKSMSKQLRAALNVDSGGGGTITLKKVNRQISKGIK